MELLLSTRGRAVLRADHRVVAVDHLGCGLSDKPSANEYPYSFAARRDDLVELIERLDLQRITLLAHGLGRCDRFWPPQPK